MRPRRFLAVVVGVALTAAACAAPSETAVTAVSGDAGYAVVDGWVGYRRTPAPDVSDVELLDFADMTDGTPFPMVAEPGELLLVYFGYLSCPDVCPTTMSDLGAALRAMPPDEAARVSVAMITVDPERDQGPQIVKYVSVFVDRAHGLVAPDAAALAHAGERFGARWEIEEHEPSATDYEVGHTATVFVVDDTGHVIWELNFGLEPADIAHTLEGLLVERYG